METDRRKEEMASESNSSIENNILFNCGPDIVLTFKKDLGKYKQGRPGRKRVWKKSQPLEKPTKLKTKRSENQKMKRSNCKKRSKEMKTCLEARSLEFSKAMRADLKRALAEKNMGDTASEEPLKVETVDAINDEKNMLQQECEEAWTPKTETEIKCIIERQQTTKVKPKCKILPKESPHKNAISRISRLKEKVMAKTEDGVKTTLNGSTGQVIFVHVGQEMQVVFRSAVVGGLLSQA